MDWYAIEDDIVRSYEEGQLSDEEFAFEMRMMRDEIREFAEDSPW